MCKSEFNLSVDKSCGNENVLKYSNLQRRSNYRVVQKKIAQSLMHRHFATVCNSNMVFTKMLIKDHCLPVDAKFLSVG